MHGLAGIPLAQAPQTRKDYTSDQEVRWCPGCGDYVILSTFQAIDRKSTRLNSSHP